MRRKESFSEGLNSAFPSEPSTSTLENGIFPSTSDSGGESTEDEVSKFIKKSNEAKLLARKLAIETEKFKELQKVALEASSVVSLPDSSSARNADLANNIDQCSKECVRLSNSINEKLMDLTAESNKTASEGGMFSSSAKHNPSIVRMKGGINAALHVKFSEQIVDFQQDVSQIRGSYIEKGRSSSSQMDKLESMIELCNEIYTSNELLSNKEDLDKWNRLDSQMAMFSPKTEPITPIQETQPLLQPQEASMFSQPASPPPTQASRTRDVENQQEEDLATHCCKRHPFTDSHSLSYWVLFLLLLRTF